MGIVNRIINIVKSNSNDLSANYESEINLENIFSAEDEKLKQLIDELNVNSQAKQADFSDKNEFETEKNSNFNDKFNNELTVAFEILGVNEKSSKKEITEAFKTKIKQFHPDMYSNLSPENKRTYEEKTLELINAMNIIKKYKN